MLDTTLIMLVLVIGAALAFDYINGFHDTANAIATCVSTRALSVRSAIVMAAVLNFAGAMISTKVAATIGKGIVDAGNVTQMVVLAGVLGAIIWDLVTWYYGLPSSSSHAIIGGIMGAVIAHAGTTALHWGGLKKIILSLILSPVIGTLLGFIVMVVMLWSFKSTSPHSINKHFRRLQVLSAAFMAFSHGTADAQKSMGVITMALVSYGTLTTFDVPTWVKIACAVAMGLGTAAGGWRIIKTVGKDFVKLQPVHGFCVETASAGVILGASSIGMPVSTTHVITSTILGVGLSKRITAVNWNVAYRILWAWVLTIPASAIMSYVSYMVLNPFLGK
ncbi:inorganic phosphate transporter [Geobacter sulfurreducens]|jgi:PiT family inorganic phosphate transporter|uniref:Phosphate/sulfate transporter family membrane protein n=1 Tax=Geobacter sulfurreducens (strain ATCC 51573 / DSM 12127 / PCA) TaxID=243231 RepID=Q74G60_GEOSL|nr:inorganic phosphate transporter [Geobacter sulfurreducens]BET60216.1 inorganic phosphate transporter [Geobacter sp. 60473]AAR33721.1 phosphate/sulfate transporter family membrane protein [Geobacter sulfurreducens PCA]ADI83220.1 phosphate/sulfate transporter family membrane protein [Geobacter sulfurreducens KN400]AJY70113.1 inorganic phosphate transporter [Geobacter sulfurreducens]QVW35646.1 inorganic phosphate transporter [Geobacter sulfurreducens]